MNKDESNFGIHLMMDCRKCDGEKISDLTYIYQFLDTLPELIGMTKIIPPYVFPYSGLVPEDKGITGMVVIAESHITFHSFTEKDYFFVDVFSCKPFDTDTCQKFIVDTFGVGDFEVYCAERGKSFPHSKKGEPS